MSSLLTCAERPCSTCPYRLDLPSGVWDAEEYAKLPLYDGEMAEQALAGATRPFDCHHKPHELLCAGWVGTHGAENLLALRILAVRGDAGDLDPAVWSHEPAVPLFASGADAAAHGLRDIEAPGPEALAAIARVARSRAGSAVPLVPGRARAAGRRAVPGSPASGVQGGVRGRRAG